MTLGAGLQPEPSDNTLCPSRNLQAYGGDFVPAFRDIMSAKAPPNIKVHAHVCYIAFHGAMHSTMHG